MNRKIILIVLVLTLIGGFLRFYKNTQNPPSLTGDEISFGYSAYSVLKTGRDEYGKFLPLTFKSVGDYKNPVPVYLMILPIKLFGLSDFSVRFPNAFFGTLTIPVFFLFLLKVIKDKKIAIIGTIFLTFSAWHISFSRFAYEPLIAAFFVLLGIWFFIKMREGKIIWSILSSFFLILTMYTAFAPRLFIPVFILAALIFNFRKIPVKNLIIFVITSGILVLPLLYVSLFQGAGTRFSMVFLINDIDFQRYVILGPMKSLQDIFLLFFFWIKRYLDYLQPGFIFLNGLGMTSDKTFGLGPLYLFEMPFLILGIIKFIRLKMNYKDVFIIWLITGLIPDSLTNNQQYAGRLLHIIPVVLIITTLGAIELFNWFLRLTKNYQKVVLGILFGGFVIINLIHAYLTFSIFFPEAKGESFDEGLREAVKFVNLNQNEYKEVIFDPRRGIEGPYMVSNPYLYVLFYTKYDPKTYQTEPKVFSNNSNYYYHFNKYTFRDIEWARDTTKSGVLFIGSPWSIPENQLKPREILDKIYLSNGSLAFLIVSPDHK